MVNIIGERVKTLLEKTGKANGIVAAEIGIAPSVLSDITRGKKKQGPSSITLQALCNYFHVSADYILGLSDIATIEPEVQAVCQYTGLDESAVAVLHSYQTGEGIYEEVFDLDEAKKEGADFLSIVNALLVHQEAMTIWRNAARSVSIDRDQGDGGQEVLEQLITEMGLESVQKVIEGLGAFWLKKDNAAIHYRQRAADTLKGIIQEIGGGELDGIDTTPDNEEW